MITARRQLLAAFGLALPLAAACAAPAFATTPHKPVHHVAHKTTTHKRVAHKSVGHKRVAHKSSTHHVTPKKPG